MLSITQFLGRPKTHAAQFISSPGSDRTILISSHIWWVDCIAYACVQLGWNVLITEPWYGMFTTDALYDRFDACWNLWLGEIRKYRVQVILGGNSTAIVPHPRTGELLHHAAGVPLINYWWDEPRMPPPLTRRGHSLETYLNALRDPQTLNVIWDADVAAEMTELFGLTNVIHVPLGTEPTLWPARSIPLAQRPLAVNFLGNCFHNDNWKAPHDPAVVARAEAVGDIRAAQPDLPMLDCLDRAKVREHFGTVADRSDSIPTSFSQWAVLEMVLRQRLRYDRIRALSKHVGNQLVVCGQGWDSLGITPHKQHSGIPAAADYYIASKASLNLFGGCVHSGMPLRPYEIACSGGLIITQESRELPDLFEPDRECLSFRTDDQMIEHVDRVLADPGAYDGMVEAARRRVLAEHTWKHRMSVLLAEAGQRLEFATETVESGIPSTL